MDVTVKKTWIKVGVLLSFLVMVVVNALANILPINGINTGAAADRYPNLFTPRAAHLRHMGRHLPCAINLCDISAIAQQGERRSCQTGAA